MKIYLLSLASVLLFFGILAMPVYSTTYPACSATCQYSQNIGGGLYDSSNYFYSTSSPTQYYCWASPSGGQGAACSAPLSNVNLNTSNATIDGGHNIIYNLTYLGGTQPISWSFYNVTSGQKVQSCSYAPAGSFCYTATLFGFPSGNGGGVAIEFPSVSSKVSTLSYNVVVTDSSSPAAVVASATNTITVYPTLVASISASSNSINRGQPVTLTASVTGGDQPYSYQWYQGSSTTYCTTENLIYGATSSTYIASPSTSTDYCVGIIDNVSKKSRIEAFSNILPVTVTSNVPILKVTTTPSGTVSTPGSITFTANVVGGVPPYTNYQWYYGSSPSCNLDGGLVEYGASATSYTATPPHAMYFCVTVTDSDSPNKEYNSSPTIYVVPTTPIANLTVSIKPTGVTTISSGQSVTITSTVTGGTPPYSYQWYGVPWGHTNPCASLSGAIPGATSATYVASPTSNTFYCPTVVDSGNPAQYAIPIQPSYIGVSGSSGSSTTSSTSTSSVTSTIAGTTVVTTSSTTSSTTSATTTIPVTKAVKVNIKPNKVLLRVGKSVTIKSVISGGSTPYSYNWSMETLPSTTYQQLNTGCLSTCIVGNLQPGNYRVELVVTDKYGKVGVAVSTKVQVISKTASVPAGYVNGTDSTGNVTYVNVGVQSVAPQQIPNNTTNQTTTIPQQSGQSVWGSVVSYFQRLFSGI